MTTMTYGLEAQIEELRAELRNADPAERAEIAAELEQARAELASMITVADDAHAAEPPQ